MAHRIVFSDLSFKVAFSPKQASNGSVTITQFQPQVYSVQTKGLKEIVFRNPQQNNAFNQKRHSELRKELAVYLTIACLLPILISWSADFFFQQDRTLTCRGMAIPLTTRAISKASSAFWAASCVVIWCVTKVLENQRTPRNELTLREQRFKFFKFKRDASVYTAAAFGITTFIGFYLRTLSRITIQGYSLTPNRTFILIAGSMLASFLALLSFDRQTKFCREEAFDLAVKVISESSKKEGEFPNPLIERKAYD